MAILMTESDTLLLHIPKCGGTFVEFMLKRLGVPHKTPEPIGGQCPLHGLASNYAPASRTVCVVRHPVDWIESWWRYNVGGTYNPADFNYIIPYATELVPIHNRVGDNFQELVETILSECPGILSRMYENYTKDCDAVARLETLSEDFERIFGLSKQRIDKMAYQNVSRPDRIPVWTHESKKAWTKAEQDIIKRWYNEEN